MQEELEAQGNVLFKYRGTLPLVILLTALGIFIYNNLTMKPNLSGLNDEYIVICFAVSIIGLLIRVFTVGYTPNRTSGRNTKEQVAEKLNTTGIYSLVRHPLYLGNFFMWLGIGMLTGNIWFNVVFFLVYWVYYERIMFAEEQFLRKKFSDEYLNWAERTPAIIPSFKNWVKPSIKFSWKKIIKKEKNGLVAVLILIFLFDLISEISKKPYFNYQYDIWFFLMIFGVVSYLAIRIIRKKTSLLRE